MATPEQRARRIALWKECAAAIALFLLVLVVPAIADAITYPT